MILTTCAACAAPLAHDAPRCVWCKTRYCNATCQHDHWRRGHKQICKRIHRGGNAEQYHADNKYKEAIAVAVEECADDTKGQTCYICTEALHWKTKEGLVRGCSCRGTAGFAHVSCLAEQAKILLAEAEENNLDNKALNEKWVRWHTCGLCEQRYHGIVFCALGWACWKSYVGRLEGHQTQMSAMSLLGNGLSSAKKHTDALSVQEAEMSMRRRFGASEQSILAVKGNLASSYEELGRKEQALRMRQEVYSGNLKINGEENRGTIIAAQAYVHSLFDRRRFAEVKSLLHKNIPLARRALGDNDGYTLRTRWLYAIALYSSDGAALDDLREAVTTLESVASSWKRVFGISHPETPYVQDALKEAREALARARATSGQVPGSAPA